MAVSERIFDWSLPKALRLRVGEFPNNSCDKIVLVLTDHGTCRSNPLKCVDLCFQWFRQHGVELHGPNTALRRAGNSSFEHEETIGVGIDFASQASND